MRLIQQLAKTENKQISLLLFLIFFFKSSFPHPYSWVQELELQTDCVESGMMKDNINLGITIKWDSELIVFAICIHNGKNIQTLFYFLKKLK